MASLGTESMTWLEALCYKQLCYHVINLFATEMLLCAMNVSPVGVFLKLSAGTKKVDT
jgi:hypothetical protein